MGVLSGIFRAIRFEIWLNRFTWAILNIKTSTLKSSPHLGLYGSLGQGPGNDWPLLNGADMKLKTGQPLVQLKILRRDPLNLTNVNIY